MDGKLAEQRMLRATGGVNTHKGAIFSMGIFCAVMGSMMEEGFGESAFAARCKALCRDLLRDFEGLEQKENISYGERLYRDYGITGIRGEAAQGFPSVLQVGLPALREGSEAGQKPQRRCAGCPAAADPGGAGHQYPHPLRPPNAAMGAAAGREGTGTGCRPRADAGAGPRLYCAQPKPRRLRRPAGAELVFVFYGPISGWFCPA